MQLHTLVRNDLETFDLDGSHKTSNKGRARVLDTWCQLKLFLFHLRHYCKEKVLSWIFGVHQSTVNRYLNTTRRIIFRCLQGRIAVPKRPERNPNSVRFNTTDHGEIIIALVVDNSEQEIYKSGSKVVEQLFYSGKKSYHSVSVLLGCSPNGCIYFLSASYPGSRNDQSIASMTENEKYFVWLEGDEWVSSDSGFALRLMNHYKGYQKSTKCSRQIDENNKFAAVRTVVENVFAQIKRWRVCGDQFRFKGKWENLLEMHHEYWYIVAWMVNSYVCPLRR